MTSKVLEHRIDPSDSNEVGRLADQTTLELRNDGGRMKVFLDGKDITDAIRTQEVTRAVSAVSAVPKVREVMVREQRRLGALGGVILEGRDIGTVVFPDADLKIFMKADVGKRAQRRQKELAQRSVHVRLDDLAREIDHRDQQDSEREVSPLRKADDALVLDTSDLSIEEQVNFIITKVEELRARNAAGDGR